MTRAVRSVAVAQDVIASVSCALDEPVDPLDFLAAFPERQRFLWLRDADDEHVAAVGATATIEAAGDTRFADVSSALATLPLAGEAERAVLVGGFAFDAHARASAPWREFPAARLVLPRLALVRRDGDTHLVATADAESGEAARAGARQLLERTRAGLGRALARGRRAAIKAAPQSPPSFRVRALAPTAAWRDAVRAALDEVEAGRLTKVVLARAIEVDAGATLDPLRVATRLRAAHPGCAVFAVLQGDAAFVGATPELLARVDGDRLRTAAVAGSAARGERARDDRARAAALRASVKDRAEHAAVVDDLAGRLRPLCRRLTVPAAPRVLRTAVVLSLFGAAPPAAGSAATRTARRARPRSRGCSSTRASRAAGTAAASAGSTRTTAAPASSASRSAPPCCTASARSCTRAPAWCAARAGRPSSRKPVSSCARC